MYQERRKNVMSKLAIKFNMKNQKENGITGVQRQK